MKLIQLKDLAVDEKNSIVDGPFGSSMKTSDYVIEGVPVLQGKNITGNKFDFFDIRFITEKKAIELSRSKVIVGDYLLVKIGSIGYLARIDNLGGFDYAIIPANLAKINIDEKKVYPIYFEQVFKQKFIKQNLIKLSSKTAQPALSLGKIRSFEIPIPEQFVDQVKIANILGTAENLISRRKESIRLLDEYLKSTFFEMFGDPDDNIKRFKITQLENLCTDIVDCPHSTPIKADGKTYFPCIRTSELKEGYIEWDSMQYLEESEYLKRTQRLIPLEGDIIYGREGTYGDAVRIPKTHKFSLGQRTMLFRPDTKKCNSIFLWAMVRSDFVYRQATKKNSGSTVGHVNVKDIKQFKVLYPPIELQTEFANIVQKIEILKVQYQSSLQELENLYHSLSQQAFKGELNAKDEEMLMAAESRVEYNTK